MIKFRRKYFSDPQVISSMKLPEDVASLAGLLHLNYNDHLSQLYEAVLSWGQNRFEKVLMGFKGSSLSKRMSGESPTVYS